MAEKKSSNSGPGLLGLLAVGLTLLFVGLKLGEVGVVATWSWVWVLSPLWIYVGLAVAIFVLLVVVVAVVRIAKAAGSRNGR